MFKMKNLVVGMLVAGSLTMVGCQSTVSTNPNEGLTPAEIVEASVDGSYQLGIYDGEKWVEKGDFTLGDVSKKSLDYAIIEGFDPEEYYKGLLTMVSFGEGNDGEDLKSLMAEWERYNGSKDEEESKVEEENKEETKEDETPKQMTIEEAADKAQNWVRKNVGSDCDIQYEHTAQGDGELVAEVYQAGETVVGVVEVDRYSGKINYSELCSECGETGHSYWDCGALYTNPECSNCGTSIAAGEDLCDACAGEDPYEANSTCGLCGGNVTMSKKEGYCDSCGARHIYDRDGSIIAAD